MTVSILFWVQPGDDLTVDGLVSYIRPMAQISDLSVGEDRVYFRSNIPEAWLDNPAHRMAHALACLTTKVPYYVWACRIHG